MTTGKRADIFAGSVMAAASAFTVLAMAHHPSGIGHGASGLAQLVHGAMIALLMTVLFGFTHFSVRRGLGRPFVLMGLVAYSVSAVAHVVAATINGFVVPAIAARGLPHDFFALCWEANQAFAYLGVYATSAAFILWSIDLVVMGRGFDRLLAFVGLAAGGFSIVMLATDALKLDVAGAFQIYTAHAVFAFLLGVRLQFGGFTQE